MSGHCDFCGIWHSGPCCHPGRAILAGKDLEINVLRFKLANVTTERDVANEEIERLKEPYGTLTEVQVAENVVLSKLADKLDKTESQLTAANKDIATLMTDFGNEHAKVEKLREAADMVIKDWVGHNELFERGTPEGIHKHYKQKIEWESLKHLQRAITEEK